MPITLSQELQEAIQEQSGRPVEFEDGVTRRHYVLMTREQFQALIYDDSELTPEEMLAAAEASLPDDGSSIGPAVSAERSA